MNRLLERRWDVVVIKVSKKATKNIAVVMAYALTLCVDNERKDSFYTGLHDAIGHIPSRDFQIVAE